MLTNVDHYISKIASKCGESVTGRSHYYQIGDKVIRVSDHIGKNSGGCFQIIVKDNGYIIYHPGTGTVNICNYRQVQEFIRSFHLMPVDDREPQMIYIGIKDEDRVLGIPASAFSPGQLNQIRGMVRKLQNKSK